MRGIGVYIAHMHLYVIGSEDTANLHGLKNVTSKSILGVTDVCCISMSVGNATGNT